MPRSDIIIEVQRALVNQRERRLRAVWRLLVGLPIFFVLWIVAQLPVGVISGLTLSPPLLAGGAILVGWLFYYGFSTGVLVGLSRWLDGRTLPGLGLGGDNFWRNLAFGLGLGIAMPTAVFLVELALGFVAVEGTLVTRPDNQFGVAVPALVAIPGTLLFFVGVGVFEEVLSRGYLFQNIAEGLSGLWSIGPREAIVTAAVVTSAFFGIFHGANANVTPLALFNIAVVGLFFAATYVLTDDLGIPIGIHVTWNFALSSLYGFPVSGLTTPATLISVRQTGPALVTGGRFGPEGGLILYLGLAVGIALTWWWVRREDGTVRFRTDLAEPDLRKGKKPE